MQEICRFKKGQTLVGFDAFVVSDTRFVWRFEALKKFSHG